jgi:5S rRNA maturation endonuclease (ribonuclease M5)
MVPPCTFLFLVSLMSNNSVSRSEGLLDHDVPREVMMLAQCLAAIHGEVVIRREDHGLHLYMASPTGIERDGAKELQSRHLTVNADRYLGFGQWRNRAGTYDRDMSAVCHKYGTKFSVSQLKQYKPLEQRGIPDVKHTVFNNAVDREKYLVDDGKGHRIPNHPGLVMPIQDLPSDHPALEYIRSRDYDVDILTQQFRCAYCYSETPENDEIKLFYKRLPGRFKDTPQGRLVFYVDIKGVQEGWQARILNKTEGDVQHHWHPYQNAWVLTHVKVNGIWHLRHDWKKEPYPWKPSKYRSANGIQRSRVVMGYDAAVAWNARHKLKTPTAILVEGPLDAGRIGPPGIAFMGKYLNEAQGDLLSREFRKIIYITDDDEAGRESKRSIVRSLAGKVDLHEAVLPKGFKDIGEMDMGAAWKLVQPYF